MFDFIDSPVLTKEEKENLRKAYDCLQIPLPNYGEFYDGITRVNFVNPAAITLRLESNRQVNLVRHPHVTRPLGTIILSEKWRLDVVQGGETSVTFEEAHAVHCLISNQGFMVDDIGVRRGEERNCLRISRNTDDFPNGFVMGYDFYALKPSSISRQLGKTPESFLVEITYPEGICDLRPKKGQMSDIQDETFGDLRDSFMQAWKRPDMAELAVNPDGMDRFWKLCLEAKKQKRITPGWLEASSKMPEGHQANTRRYEKRLKETSPAFA